jgi:hypothetical protein
MPPSALRGEAVALRSNVPQDIHIVCANSIIALAEPFLYTEESRRMTNEATILIRWNRVAFFGRQGVALLLKDIAHKPINVNFESQNSVFVLHRSPFVSFRGTRNEEASFEEFQLLVWRNNNFQGMPGIQFRTPSTADEIPLLEWLLSTPNAHAETHINALPLRVINKPMSRYLPRDVRLLYEVERVSIPDFESWWPDLWNSE